ncbi:hypothetical protein Lalb_Chr12g0203381 [Lupinus albus]|uniref:Uncharacterized protein n=1 Tax=Lupinus albus TaxID=3870 RepID=A0A6A4PMT8_LUPAL|nr:hypothetical protein Lalb_Chr12g0203381 [Lupinus albus]
MGSMISSTLVCLSIFICNIFILLYFFSHYKRDRSIYRKCRWLSATITFFSLFILFY